MGGGGIVWGCDKCFVFIVCRGSVAWGSVLCSGWVGLSFSYGYMFRGVGRCISTWVKTWTS